eukprot:sb/3472735/
MSLKKRDMLPMVLEQKARILCGNNFHHGRDIETLLQVPLKRYVTFWGVGGGIDIETLLQVPLKRYVTFWGVGSFLESGAVQRLVRNELNRNDDTDWVVALSRDRTALRSSTSFHQLLLRKVPKFYPADSAAFSRITVMEIQNRPNQEIPVPDWLITSHVTK